MLGDGRRRATRSPGAVDNVEYRGRDSLVDVVTRVGHAAARARAGDAARWAIDASQRAAFRVGARARLPDAMIAHEHGSADRAARCARAPFDRTLLLVVPAALFMLLLFVYPFLYGLVAVVQAEGGRRARQLPHFFTDRQSLADDLDHAQARAARDADQRRPRAADRVQDAREVARTSAGSRRSSSCRSRSAPC